MSADHGTMYTLHGYCLSIPYASPPRSRRRVRHHSQAVFTGEKTMTVLAMRVCGRVFTIMAQRSGAHPVNFDGCFDRETLSSGNTLYAIGPCVVYVAQASRGGCRFEIELGRLALSF